MDLGPAPGDFLAGDARPIVRGTLLGGYRVLERIGEGGMGEVLRCRDEQLDRDVAIKLIRPGRLDEGVLRLRFLDEARAMARVRHPNVVAVHAYGEFEGIPYFVMEYVPGVDAAKLLKARGRLAVADVLRIVDGVVRGVEAMHAVGTVHGDLKPGNILVGPGDRVSVIDLGLSRIADRVDREAATVIAGTPAYMAPERMTDIGGLHGPAIDIYAIGVIAYELLTGNLPFSGAGALEILAQHAYEEPTPLSLTGLRIDPEVEAAIMEALSKDPEERPTASSFGLRLRQASAKGGETLRRILLIDDDKGCLRATRELLEEEFPGVAVEAHHDPRPALEGALRRPPDIALVDLHLPGVDGFEVVRALRADRRTEDVPIVVLTGLGGARDWQRLHAMGVSAFLVKPLDAGDLMATVRRAVARRRGAGKV